MNIEMLNHCKPATSEDTQNAKLYCPRRSQPAHRLWKLSSHARSSKLSVSAYFQKGSNDVNFSSADLTCWEFLCVLFIVLRRAIRH